MPDPGYLEILRTVCSKFYAQRSPARAVVFALACARRFTSLLNNSDDGSSGAGWVVGAEEGSGKVGSGAFHELRLQCYEILLAILNKLRPELGLALSSRPMRLIDHDDGQEFNKTTPIWSNEQREQSFNEVGGWVDGWMDGWMDGTS